MSRLLRLLRVLFVTSSTLTVLACGVAAARGHEARLMAAGPEWESFGLTYVGPAGARLAFVEVALVLAAWFLARKRGPVARLGGLLLVAWACLWCANAVGWTKAAPDGMSEGILAGLVLALLACLWTTRAPRLPLGDEAA